MVRLKGHVRLTVLQEQLELRTLSEQDMSQPDVGRKPGLYCLDFVLTIVFKTLTSPFKYYILTTLL